jgi:hypothetical protein
LFNERHELRSRERLEALWPVRGEPAQQSEMWWRCRRVQVFDRDPWRNTILVLQVVKHWEEIVRRIANLIAGARVEHPSERVHIVVRLTNKL